MSPRPPLPQGPYLVVGLARSGRAAALALRARGQSVVGVDARKVDPGTRKALEAAGADVHEQTDGVALLAGVRALVKSPGVPGDAAVIRAAARSGIAVLGELELGWRLVPNQCIAITGTNGKTTTTELVGAIHRAAGLPVAVAGNVGTPLSTLAGALSSSAVVVCEASSFQLEDAGAFAPDAAVLLNLSPDHLDRHGTFTAYRAAKARIFAHQPPGALAVLPAGVDLGGTARRVTFAPVAPADSGTRAARDADARLQDGRLCWRGRPIMPAAELRLRGRHNVENALAAMAVALSRGIPADAVRAALRRFAGVAHRLAPVAEIDGVAYVDDSKATNVASAVVAIGSFPDAAGVHVLLGGRGKGEDYAPLARAMRARGAAAYLVGEEADRLAAALADAGVRARRCGEVARAVADARARAGAGDVVLLAPACASFDQYASFEARGLHFQAVVRAFAGGPGDAPGPGGVRGPP